MSDEPVIVRDRLFDLRDYFAGQALCGLIAQQGISQFDTVSLGHVAQRAYACADAMLKQRALPPTP